MKSKVIIFGAWQEGVDLFFEIYEKVEVVAFMDNNPILQSKEIYGIKIISPNEIEQVEYDEIFISSSRQYQSMKTQLLSLNVERKKIKNVFGINKIKMDLNLTKYYFNHWEKEYEARWIELKRKYDQIFLFALDVSCIGEMAIRLWKMIEDEECIGGSVLRLFIPQIGGKKRICNSKFIELVNGKLNIINDNFEFWEYVLNVHNDDINTFNYNKYLYRDWISHRIVKQDYVYVSFRESQIEIGKKQLSKMGIYGEYVCLASRSSEYAQNTLMGIDQRKANIEAHEYRNSNFYDYVETINWLESMNIQGVRMGRGEEPIKQIRNCIDYAGLYANDFMDLFLMANCKFAVIGGGSGIFSLATTFGRPVLFVNLIPISLGNGGEAYVDNDMYIPKKVLDRNSRKYLSLLEIASVEQECLIDGKKYDEKGVEFVDNTSEEILEATKELMLRMSGHWVDTEEDILLYQQYLSILSYIDEKSKANINNWTGGVMPRRFSMSYLKKNLYLLDGE